MRKYDKDDINAVTAFCVCMLVFVIVSVLVILAFSAADKESAIEEQERIEWQSGE